MAAMDRRIRTSFVSIGVDLALFGVKVWLAMLVGSLALLADAYHSMSDMIISTVILASMFLRRHLETANQEEEKDDDAPPRPRGFIKWLELGIAFVVSGVIFFMAFNVFSQLYGSEGYELRRQYLWLALLGTGICATVAYFVSRFKILVGREEGSPALVADGYHSRMDMFSSLGVMVAVLGNWIGIRLDPVVAVVISLLIAYTGLELLAGAIRSLIRDDRGDEPYRPTSISRGIERLQVWFNGRFKGLRPPEWFTLSNRRLWKRVGAVASVVATAAYFASGLYSVGPDQTGVKLRFGRVVEGAQPPGIHYRLPWPFESTIPVNRDLVRRVEVGFRIDPQKLTTSAPTLWEAGHSRRGYRKLEDESISMTGRENLADLSVVVHFVPRDAVTHLFRVAELEGTVRGVTEAGLREILGRTLIDDLLTGRRQEVLEELSGRLQEDADRYGLGIDVLSVYCHDLHPPVPVVHAFRSVFSAWENQLRRVNRAQASRNQELPKARASVVKKMLDAEASRDEAVSRAKGEADRFETIAEAAAESPEVTRFRLYMESVEDLLEGVEKIIADHRVNRGSYQRWMFAPP